MISHRETNTAVQETCLIFRAQYNTAVQETCPIFRAQYNTAVLETCLIFRAQCRVGYIQQQEISKPMVETSIALRYQQGNKCVQGVSWGRSHPSWALRHVRIQRKASLSMATSCGHAPVMWGPVMRLGKLEIKSRGCRRELEKVFIQILKYFHSKVKEATSCSRSSQLIPVTFVLLTQLLCRAVPVVCKGPRCQELDSCRQASACTFYPTGGCPAQTSVSWSHTPTLPTLPFALSHPPARVFGDDFVRPPQVPASMSCDL